MSESPLAAENNGAESVATPVRKPAWALPALLGVQLACLLLLAVLGFFGWQLWQQRATQGAQGAQQQAQLGQLQQQLADSAQQLQKLQSRLSDLPDSASQLQQQQRLLQQLEQAQGAMERRMLDSQQQLGARLDALSGSHAVRNWQLNEAFYQMRLASLRLEVMQDSKSAQWLLKNADELLRQQDDPAGFATRKALASALQQLERLSVFDRSGLYLKLAALQREAAQLATPLPQFRAPQAAPAAASDSPWWQHWRDRLAGYVRIDFDAPVQDIRPLLGGQSLQQARLALRLALEQAQWALLHGEAAVYGKSLEQAGEVLKLAFNLEDSATQQLQSALAALRGEAVAQPMPDLAPLLAAMQQYLRTQAEALEKARAAAREEADEDSGDAEGEGDVGDDWDDGDDGDDEEDGGEEDEEDDETDTAIGDGAYSGQTQTTPVAEGDRP